VLGTETNSWADVEGCGMRLVFATEDLTLAGRSFVGFPLLVGSDGWPVEPAQSFLWHILIEVGEALSISTWEAYGRRLFDYFAFLEANGLSWNEESVANGLSVLARYRDWSSGELGLDPGTVNKRLGLIVRFYRLGQTTCPNIAAAFWREKGESCATFEFAESHCPPRRGKHKSFRHGSGP